MCVCAYLTTYLSIHLLMDTDFFYVLAIVNNASMNMDMNGYVDRQSFIEHRLLGTAPGAGNKTVNKTAPAFRSFCSCGGSQYAHKWHSHMMAGAGQCQKEHELRPVGHSHWRCGDCFTQDGLRRPVQKK